MPERPNRAAIDLFWIPLGAGGAAVVRTSGRVYEAIAARREHRPPQHLYHTALEVTLDRERYTIENAWPSPDANHTARGVQVEGPVGSVTLARLQLFRYEIRCWRDGIVPDIAEAVGGPHRLSDDPAAALRIIELVPQVPPLVWGRDVLGVGDMWNSNSVISYLLTRSGLGADTLTAPNNGRAPGWRSGIVLATQGSDAVIP